MVISDKYSRAPVSSFYLSRALRIYPTYLLVLILAAWSSHMLDAFLSGPTTTGMWIFAALSNITIIGLSFVPIDGGWILIGPAWSLAIELQFYLAAPFILARRLSVCISVLAVLIALRLVYLGDEFNYWRFSFPPSAWCFFMLGAVSHRLGLLVTADHIRKRIGWIAIAALPALGFACGLPIVKDLDRPELWLFYLAFASAIPFVFSVSKHSQADQFLGDLSYPIYISHTVVSFSIYGIAIYRVVPAAYYREIFIAVILATSVALHFGIERPIDIIRGRLARVNCGVASRSLSPIYAVRANASREV